MVALFQAVLFTVLFYVVPLLGVPARILDPRVAFLALGSVVMFTSQPAVTFREAAARSGNDRFSYFAIMGAGLVSQLVPVIHWGYLGAYRPLREDLAWVVPGAALVVGGLAFRVWAIRVLGRNFTATVETREDQPVVRTGPYAVVRHPSYLGSLVAVTGSAIVLHSLPGTVLAFVAMLAAYAYRVTVEEEVLLRDLGEAYAAYREDVRSRLLPGIW